jgi:thiamine-phosphate pyrophosphorylase
MEKHIYSAIDANINRCLEGLRVCEDIMRFCLKNTGYSSRFKELRHRVAAEAVRFSHSALLFGRDVDADSQKFIDLETEKSRGSLEALLSANLHRATEALRSLEEFGKLIYPDKKENPFQEIRFSLYSLERDAGSALLRLGKCDRFRRSLYAIVDSAHLKGGRYYDAAEKMIRGGASIIQLRMKNISKKEIMAQAKDLALLCRNENVLFIVNDYPDIAVLTGADGVHLGLNDLDVRDARRLVPPDMIVGLTAYSFESVYQILDQGPDYIAIGPIYDTIYDSGTAALPLKGMGSDVLGRMKDAARIPLVAIGGITAENAGEAISAGADSVAVVSSIYQSGGIEKNCRSLVNAIGRAGSHE